MIRLRFAIVILIAQAGAASAINLNNQDCYKSQVREFTQFVERAAIGVDGIDDRGIFDEAKARAMGMNIDEKYGYPNDYEDIQNGFGKVECPGTIGKYPDPKKFTDPTGKRYNSSAELGGLIVQTDDLLVTNTHGLIDHYGRVGDPISKCTFTTASGKKINLGLKDGVAGLREAVKSGKIKISGIDLEKGEPFEIDQFNDRVLIRLPEPVKDAAFMLEGTPELRRCSEAQPKLETSFCQRIAVISAFSDKMPMKVPEGKIIAQQNFIRTITAPYPGGGRILGSGASSAPGTSSSVVFAKRSDGEFIRDYQGRLRPIGILQGGSNEDGDGKPFGVRLKSGNPNGTNILLFDNDFEKDILEMARGSQKQISSEPSGNPKPTQ